MLLSFHSYKGGTGKTTFVSNLGVHLAQYGQKICIIDTDVNGPGLHSLFDVHFSATLVDFLRDECKIAEIIYKPYKNMDLYIVPSKACEEDITSMFGSPGEAKDKLLEIIKFLKRQLQVDHVLFDCSPGINKSSLLIMNIADRATIVSTIDVQDIRGTYILSSMSSKLGTKANLLFNRTPRDKSDEINVIVTEFSKKLGTSLLGSLNFDDTVARTWSRKLVALEEKDCGYCQQLQTIATRMLVP
ncbi:MAG: MinD/ParA family protein [Methanomethylovorans sp.]|uniref:MinD/ParA family ATP-binding protein n=1 Tax=Methanomethylovorans sp. TaxID=2758717 RepID=UPI000ACA64E6|nr:MinD/ParA family protein [Methanomethylovorans sp.]